jgi:2-oxoglutarate ferredoxin oxidoreductase subunit beta
VYKLEDDESYDVSNPESAVQKSFEWGDRIPIGLFYQDELPTYEDSEPAFKQGPLVHHKLGLDRETFEALMLEFV